MTITQLRQRLNRPEFDPLTQEREAELGALYREALEAEDNATLTAVRDELINRHLRLVIKIGKQYQSKLEWEDIFATGALALTQAAERWHPDKGQMFKWAQRWITTALTRASDANRMIRIPQQIAYQAGLLQRDVKELEETLGRSLTRAELEQITEGRTSFDDLPSASIRLDHPQAEYDDEPTARTLADTIEDPEQDPHRSVEKTIMIEAVRKAILELTPLEREIITHRFGLDGGSRLTLSQLGDRHNVTGEAMRRVEATALAKLRHPALLQPILED